jgi:hypothetical protein
MGRGLLVITCVVALLGAAVGSAEAATAKQEGRGRVEVGSAERDLVPLVNCSTPLRLWDGTYETGAMVSIYARGVWVNLNIVNFGDKTSSYIVGSCSVELADGQNGSGSRYPYCLSAGCVENVMASGWDNRISSVYLH